MTDVAATHEAAGGPAPGGAAHESDAGILARIKDSWQAFLLRYAMVWILIVLAVFANFLYSGFFAPENLNNTVAQVSATGIVAVGMTYAIIAGGFDLSVAAVFAGASVVFADLSNSMPLWVAFVLTVVVGLVCGVINGVVITKMKVNSFIATLATASLFSGAAYLYSKSAPVLTEAKGFDYLGSGKTIGVWNSVWLLLIFVLALGFILGRTPYGRSVFAVGGNLEAARLAGMRTTAIRVSTFGITSICAAVGGMIVASQTLVGQANIGGTVTLDSIAIVIIGGTSLLGGEGAMWRTVVGILIWGTISNVFASLALDTSTQLLMQGAILLIAVSLDALTRLRRP